MSIVDKIVILSDRLKTEKTKVEWGRKMALGAASEDIVLQTFDKARADEARAKRDRAIRGAAAARGDRTADQTAATITSKADRNRWVEWGDTGIPAPTVAGDPRLPKRKYRRDGERQMDGAVKMELWEAAVLQSFPADFPFQGKKGKQFLQVGNAVPPLMAEAILRTFLN